ncbi:MAG: serine/threonine-protein kinase [Polyangiaceae bacterium]
MAEVLPMDELVEEPSDFGALRPGSKLGRYELLIPVARGGMARVWAARQHGQRGFTKLVAVKTILPHLAREEEFERMFLDEARIASGVHHPNVCEIYELGDERGTLYMAMEWVSGDSFSRVLRTSGKTEPVEPRVAARVIADACAGLHAAHELVDENNRHMGVVHRDLSPHNILITGDGVAKVADFGVAKALGQLHEATSAGQLKGKISYMAPEQVTGAEVDRRSDVFSLGCVLYESTTGQKPFKGDGDHQVMHALLQGDVTPPSQIIRSYPQALERIVLRALSPQALLRFPTAEQMRYALEEFLARSGQLVTQANVAQTVRARIGPLMDRRKERIRLASQAGDRDAWQDAAHMTPSGARATSASGVKQSVPAAGRPLYSTMQMQQPPPAGAAPEPPPPQVLMPGGAPAFSEPSPHSSPGYPAPMQTGPFAQQPAAAPPMATLLSAPQAPAPQPPAPASAAGPPPPVQRLSTTLALPSPFNAEALIQQAQAQQDTQAQPGPPQNAPQQHAPQQHAPQQHAPQQQYAAPQTHARGYVATGSHDGVESAPVPLAAPDDGGAPQRSAASTGQYAIAIGVGVGLAVLIGGGGFFAYRSRRAHDTASAPHASTAVAAAVAPSSTAPPVATGGPAPTVEGDSLAFNVSPAQAVLVVDGKPLGVGVRSIPRPKEGSPLTVRVQAVGFEDEVVRIDAQTPSPVEIVLRDAAPTLELGDDAGATASDDDTAKPRPKPKSTEPALPDNPY